MIRAILTLGTLVAVVALLAGCEVSTSPYDSAPGEYTYTTCTNYTLTAQDLQFVEVVDSTATCPDNSAPFLYRAQWLSTDSSCPSILSTVVGGLAGIRHTYGCWRPAAKYTGPPI